ncbi:hypothetical protein Pmani_034483 [Petrolisthes manimaculis]|uniref:Uncharacterized protein n=1 Tax=Petrolisthes manimaculis TaxID=1843537 RepID=A0AAE1NP86_9EUCA|nr:hypothetical protein Pmani_034483 [Petrolisthes manimaculis]
MGEIPMIPTNDTSSMDESRPVLANSTTKDLNRTELTRIPEGKDCNEDSETSSVNIRPGKISTNLPDHRLSDAPPICTTETNGDSTNSNYPVKHDGDKVYQTASSSVLETGKILRSPVIFNHSVTDDNSAELKSRTKTAFSDVNNSTVAKVALENNTLSETSQIEFNTENSKVSEIQNSREKIASVIPVSLQNDTVERDNNLTLIVNNTKLRTACVPSSDVSNKRYKKNKRRRYLRKIGYYKSSPRRNKVENSSTCISPGGREMDIEEGAADRSVLALPIPQHSHYTQPPTTTHHTTLNLPLPHITLHSTSHYHTPHYTQPPTTTHHTTLNLPLPHTTLHSTSHYHTPHYTQPPTTTHHTTLNLPLPHTTLHSTSHYHTPHYTQPPTTTHHTTLNLPLPHTTLHSTSHYHTPHYTQPPTTTHHTTLNLPLPHITLHSTSHYHTSHYTQPPTTKTFTLNPPLLQHSHHTTLNPFPPQHSTPTLNNYTIHP